MVGNKTSITSIASQTLYENHCMLGGSKECVISISKDDFLANHLAVSERNLFPEIAESFLSHKYS